MIAWNILQESYLSGRIPSGIILNSVTHAKALVVAEKFAKLLLCEDSKNGDACGKCKSCLYIEQKSHPELCYITKEDGSEVIKIDQVRFLIAKLQQTPLYGKHKVMIIVAAESMHEMAMNALLKTLEQPPGNATIILVTTKADSIPATIKSRCSCLNIKGDDLAKIAEELSLEVSELVFANFLADSNKDMISQLLESSFVLYETVVNCFLLQNVALNEAFDKNTDVAAVVAYSHKLVMLCIKIKQGCEPHFIGETFAFSDIYNISNANNIVSWYKLYDYHVELQAQLSSPVPLNTNTMLLELYSNWKIIEKAYVS